MGAKEYTGRLPDCVPEKACDPFEQQAPSEGRELAGIISGETLRDLAKYLRMEPSKDNPTRYESHVAKIRWCADQLDKYAAAFDTAQHSTPRSSDSGVVVSDAQVLQIARGLFGDAMCLGTPLTAAVRRELESFAATLATRTDAQTRMESCPNCMGHGSDQGWVCPYCGGTGAIAQASARVGS